MFGRVIASVLATVLAGYVYGTWRDYSKTESCNRGLTQLREKFDQRRAEIRNPAPMDRAIAQATELCAKGEHDKARQLIDVTIATCRSNGSCVLRNRS
ncbi:MAG TPA: hypothetical protein VH765_10615 [Xanthobacteraceae bacterium]|jgi:hypothetical protein